MGDTMLLYAWRLEHAIGFCSGYILDSAWCGSIAVVSADEVGVRSVRCTLSELLSVMVSHFGYLDCYQRCAASACLWLVYFFPLTAGYILRCHAVLCSYRS
jgi:hypothetical protein